MPIWEQECLGCVLSIGETRGERGTRGKQKTPKTKHDHQKKKKKREMNKNSMSKRGAELGQN